MENAELKNNMTEAIIEVQNLQIKFGKQEVLKDVSLNLYKGENLVVLGKSGSGKSVLIKCIVNLLTFKKGTIKVFGDDILLMNRNEISSMRKKIGFLFQSGALYDSMTVKENIEFPLRRIKAELNEKEIDEKVKEVLENVGLIDSINKMPSQLSGGMRKRISLARTIVIDPLIMLYDEPTTGLDPITANEISELIKNIQEKYNTASIIITHDIQCARTTADRLVMLREGEIYLEGNLKQFEESKDEMIMSFFK
jgi:phospholipid/cholesterol/gamma-HCH transport system ATP-binding protein